MRHIRLDEVHRLACEHGDELPATEPAFPCRDRHGGLRTDLHQRIDPVRRARFLEEHRVEPLDPARHLDRRRYVEPSVSFDEEFDVIADSFPHRSHRLEHPVEVAIRDCQIGGFEWVPFEAAEPCLQRSQRCLGEVLRRDGARVPPVGVCAHPVTGLTAEKGIDRNAQRPGSDIPHRHLESAERSHRHRATAPIGVALKLVDRLRDTCRIFTLHSFAEDRDRPLNGELLPFEGGFRDPYQSLVGMQAHDDEVRAVEVDGERIEMRDLHGSVIPYPLTAPAVMPATTYFCANR